jgi:xanthine dehydrogenase accessory factor
VFGQQIRPLVAAEDPLPPGTVGVVVASHGNDEAPVLTRALQAGVPYVGLVASRVRGPAVVDALDVADDLRRAVRTPAGFDIGARTPAEVALSILAEIVASQHDRTPADRAAEARAAAFRAAVPRRGAAGQPPTARDPVCGMTVAAVDGSPQVHGPNGPVYFCGSGCRAAYLDHPSAYAT